MKPLIQRSYKSFIDNFNLAFRHSFLLTALFAIVFLVCRMAGLYQVIELRFINYALFFPIGFLALKRAFLLNGGHLEYFNGLMIGFLILALGQFWYALLFFLYLFVDSSFLAFLTSMMPQPLYYPRLSVFFVMVGEGFAAGAISSLALMQYFKWKAGRWAVSA